MSDWYKESFGEDYLIVYRHRDMAGAREEVKRMIDWLKLPAGAEVLDLCCGMGRHALALHDFGYQVTGVDLSEVLLTEARALDEQGQVRWLAGDMRDVPLAESFDAVVNLFTSFGYFAEDIENRKVLREIERLLKLEGKFIIDSLNPHVVERNLVPYSEREDDGLSIEERRKIEDGYVMKEITIRPADGDERRYLERVKLYDLAWFEQALAPTQLQIDHVYGDYLGNAYDEANSPRLIFVGHKTKQKG